MKKICIITTYKGHARFTNLNDKKVESAMMRYLKCLQAENASAHIVFDYEHNLATV
jgi:hypothetical protein